MSGTAAVPLLQHWATQPFTRAYRVRTWRLPDGYADGPRWRRTVFVNAQGVCLAGLFQKTDRAPRGIVVCAHPLRRDAKGFFLRYGHAEALRRSGYHVLLFDFNGFGESSAGGCLWPLDVVPAGHHAARLAPELPVGVLGVSFGAAWVACALADARHNFDAAVLENPFTTLSAYFGRVPWQAHTIRLLERLMPREAVALCPVGRLRAARRVRSLLFVYGERHAVTPVAAGRQFMRSCASIRSRRVNRASRKTPAGFELWTVPGAGHNEAIRTAPEAYRARMAAAFERSSEAHRPGQPSTKAPVQSVAHAYALPPAEKKSGADRSSLQSGPAVQLASHV